VNEPVRRVLAQLARGEDSVVAVYASGVTNRRDKPSRTIMMRND